MAARKTYRDYLFVGMQAVLFLFFLLNVEILSSYLGWISYAAFALILVGAVLIALALLQLRTTLSPFPTPVSHGRLVTNGVFALARHPIYTGILLMAIGYSVYASSFLHYALTAGLIILFYFKSRYEEMLLLGKYPAYQQYRQRVGRFARWF